MRFIAPILALSACFLLSACTITPTPSNDVIAKVGSIEVTSAQLQDRILGRYYGSRALLGLVQEKLFQEEAARRQITISELDLSRRIEAELTRLFGEPGPQRDRNISELSKRGLDLVDVRRELRAELLNSMLINRVVQACRQISDEQIDHLYRSTYESPRVRLRHIAFPFDTDCADDPSHVEMVRTQAERIARELTAGADFSALAKAHSGNRRTASSGGEIGWVNQEVMKDEALAQSVFGLEVGSFSEPLREGDYGYHIFEVEDRIDPSPIDQVRDELVAHLRNAPATADEILAVERQLRNQIDVEVYPVALRRGIVERVPGVHPPTSRLAKASAQSPSTTTDAEPNGIFSASDRSPIELLEEFSPDLLKAPFPAIPGTEGSTGPGGVGTAEWDTDDIRQ